MDAASGAISAERLRGMKLKILNLIMFVLCEIVAALQFQHGNVWTSAGMTALGLTNLLLGVR